MEIVPVARDIMRVNVPVLHPEEPVLTAMRMLHRKKQHAVIIVDSDLQLAGIITEKDCLRALCEEAYDHMDAVNQASIASFMSSVPETLSPEMDVFAVASAFLRSNFMMLPVVQEGVLVGAICRWYLIAAIVDMLEHVEVSHERKMHELATESHPQSIHDLIELAAGHSREQLKRVFSRRHQG